MRVPKKTKQDVYLAQSIKTNFRDSAEFFDAVYNALLNLDTKAAPELLKKPGLISASYADINAYTLHAVLLLISSEKHNWKEILNDMNDGTIFVLRSFLHNFILPEKITNVEKHLNDLTTKDLGYVKGTELTYTQIEKGIADLDGEDALKAKSKFVSIIVAQNWDDIMAEMKEMSDALNTFQRQPKEKVVDTDKTKDVEIFKDNDDSLKWTTDELVKKLGYSSKASLFSIKSMRLKGNPKLSDEVESWFFNNGRFFYAKYFEKLKEFLHTSERAEIKPTEQTTNTENELIWSVEELAKKLNHYDEKTKAQPFFVKKSYILKKHPELKEEIKSWFTADGSKFYVRHFDELQKLVAKHTKIKKTDSVKNAAPEKPETKVVMPKEKTNQDKSFDLVDIKALETYLDSLQKIIDHTNQTKEKCDNLLKEAMAETDVKKRKDLLEKAIYENDMVETSQEQLESIEAKLNQGKQLLKTRNEVFKKLQSVNAEIKEFMGSNKQH